jgi:hemerythrin-like domain-containing protein
MTHRAVQIIRAEHRSLAAVVHGLLYFARRIRKGKAQTEFGEAFRAMLFYIDVFSERFHHPKEDRYLFARLRQRTRDAEDIISRLEGEHACGAEEIRSLMQAAIRLEHGGDAYAADFVVQVEAFARFQMRHMGLEEEIVLPLAEKILTDDDWREIDAAFMGNSDPLVGTEAKGGFDQLLARVLSLASSPIVPQPEVAEAK